jgi:hypothetical protein
MLVGASFLGFIAACVFRPVYADEAWILVVARRVARGELLYRDVFYGTGPAPLWPLVAACKGFGFQIWVLRLLCAISSGTVAACLIALGERHDLGGNMVVMLVATELALCGFGGADSLYSSITKAAAIGSVLCLTSSEFAKTTVLAGCVLGVAMSAKHTIGIVAAAGDAILIIAMEETWIGTFQRLCVFFGAAGFVIAILVSPVIARRGLSPMIFRLGKSKISFVRHGTIGLRRGFSERWETAPLTNNRATSLDLTKWARRFESSVFATVLVVPLLPTTMLGHFESLDARDIELIVLALIWIAVIAPRADVTHVFTGCALAATVALLALERAGQREILNDRWVGWSQVLIAIWLGLVILVRVGAVVRLSPRNATRFALSCRWVKFSEIDSTEAGAFATMVNETSNGRSFLLGCDAPLVWLITDLTNPTPYDYPLASTFGPYGEREVAAVLSAGTLPLVGIYGSIEGPNQPATILAALNESYSVDAFSAPPTLRIARCLMKNTQANVLATDRLK